jgi:hypothetical protein
LAEPSGIFSVKPVDDNSTLDIIEEYSDIGKYWHNNLNSSMQRPLALAFHSQQIIIKDKKQEASDERQKAALKRP